MEEGSASQRGRKHSVWEMELVTVRRSSKIGFQFWEEVTQVKAGTLAQGSPTGAFNYLTRSQHDSRTRK